MNLEPTPKDFYSRLEKKLAEDFDWPSDYMYKFIVPTEKGKIEQVEALFNHLGAVITTRKSSKGNYTSVSVLARMKNPQAVIDKYKEAAGIAGIISL